ncbi:MAG: hypothetical protein ACYTFG_22720, partial [Planctomycetota bacterium]
LESLEKALEEFRRLNREFPGTPAHAAKEPMVVVITEKFRVHWEAEGDRRFNSREWTASIESFDKAKLYADELRSKAIDDKIGKARFQIDQSEILPKARDMRARGDLQGMIDLLEGVPVNSPIRAEALSMIREAKYSLNIQKAQEYYRQGDAENALRILELQEFSGDPDFAALRDKVKGASSALAKGDAAFEKALADIHKMETPHKVVGFEDARRYWNEVKDIESTDSSNAFVRQAERKLYDLTDEKIGGMYFEKAESLLDTGVLRKGREFMDLARQYDPRLGLERLKEWKNAAGKKYNRAINLKNEDEDEARNLLTWILDVLRPGDSEYYEKAQKALAGLPRKGG